MEFYVVTIIQVNLYEPMWKGTEYCAQYGSIMHLSLVF